MEHKALIDESSAENKPAICPLANCQAVVKHTHLLRHMISEHLGSRARTLPFQLRLREVSTGQRTLLMLAYRQLIVDHDQCLAVLNWSTDSRIDLMAPQLDLPPCHQGLTFHLPVLVMVCRTTWKSLLKQGLQHENDVQVTRDLTTEWGTVYLLWLVSPFTRRPIYVNIAVLNSQLQCVVRRNRRRVRNFASRMPISQFINGLDPFFVSLNEDQLDELCDGSGNRVSVFLEVIIKGETS
ncbi:uncharacterized protein LOC6551063 [Drosophila erecta]|uniref:DUF4729 domain-containing protein n=1 Tax=Drosophila erecta TaxID=7220 RepID=B3NU74_DROER|nr:uncharacterized protein LOC6551063 [Drosophila erecta]EDV45850.1 uncharacterized protein Dere_GG18730 [Drosophila erecta]